MREEIEMLEDHPDIFADFVDVRFFICDDHIIDFNLTLVDIFK